MRVPRENGGGGGESDGTSAPLMGSFQMKDGKSGQAQQQRKCQSRSVQMREEDGNTAGLLDGLRRPFNNRTRSPGIILTGYTQAR